MLKPFLRLLIECSSRKSVSRMLGKFAKSSLSRKLIPRFVRIYGINLEHAEKNISEYVSLNEFFTRRLKPGVRPLDPQEDALLSPVDGTVTGMGPIESGLFLNIKRQNYTVEQLLNRSPRMINYTNGYYFVLYLSPTDYHRIHSPATGRILEKEHIPGKVYPVNDFGMRYMPGILSRNERLVTYIQHQGGEMAVVKVGAMNVSGIHYVQPLAAKLERGEELAYFEFGSTVVLLLENGSFRPTEGIRLGDKVRMGQALGTLKAKK